MTTTSGKSRPMEILLVEDNDSDVELTRASFTRLKLAVNVHHVKDGEECMAFLRRQGKYAATPFPDVMLLDLNMPEVDGFSFLKNFKELPDQIKSKSKIVVLTSSNSAKDRSQAFTFPNVIQFITKPLKQTDIEDLKKLINHSEFTGQANS